MAAEDTAVKVLQWQRLQQHSSRDSRIFQRLSNLYTQYKFPIEVRGHFAQWIEDKPWDEVWLHGLTFQNQNQVQQFGCQMLKQLLELVDTKVSQSNDLVHKLMFSRSAELLRNVYDGNEASLVSVISTCLKEELLLLNELEPESDPEEEMEEDFELVMVKEDPQIIENLNRSRQEVNSLRQKSWQLKNSQEDFTVYFQESRMKIQQLDKEMKTRGNHTEKAKEKENLRKEMEVKQMDMIDQHERMIDQYKRYLDQYLQPVHNKVQGKISEWQERQQKAVVGLVQEINLDEVQKWCLEHMESIQQMICNLNEEESLLSLLTATADQRLEQQKSTVHTMLNELIHNSFVVETQPPLTLKNYPTKSLKFEAGVRFLIADSLNVHREPPEVIAEFYGEEDIEAVGRTVNTSTGQTRRGGRQPRVPQTTAATPAAEIMNGKSRMVFDKSTAKLSVKFEKMTLKKFRRTERRSKDTEVTDQKYGIVFSARVKLGEEEYHLRAVSQPIVMIVQSSQDPNALATNLWHHAFAEIGGKSYNVTKQVSWPEFAKFLSGKFHKSTGRGLNSDHLLFLARKLFNEPVEPGDLDARSVTFRKFCKDRLEVGPNCSFWKWFYSCLNLTELCLKESWRYGLVHGFISKEDVIEKLTNKNYGTFILRFSESEIESSERAQIRGALTLAVVVYDYKTAGPQVHLVKEHFSADELEKTGLAPTLKSLQVEDVTNPKEKNDLLTFLYPDKPLLQILQKYPELNRSPARTPSDPYTNVKTLRVIDLPAGNASSSLTPSQNYNFLPSPRTPSVMSENNFSQTDEDTRQYMPDAGAEQQDGGAQKMFQEAFDHIDPKLLDQLNFVDKLEEQEEREAFVPQVCSTQPSSDTIIMSNAMNILNGDTYVESEVEVSTEDAPQSPESVLSGYASSHSQLQMSPPAVPLVEQMPDSTNYHNLAPSLNSPPHANYMTLREQLNQPILTRSAVRNQNSLSSDGSDMVQDMET